MFATGLGLIVGSCTVLVALFGVLSMKPHAFQFKMMKMSVYGGLAIFVIGCVLAVAGM